MMKFIRETISERWNKVRVEGSISQSKQTYMGTPQEGVLSITLFFVTINVKLVEFVNGENESLFADDLAMYITIRNQKETS